VRSTAAWIAALVAAGAGLFSWQRMQIAALREQVARQGADLAEGRERMDLLSRLAEAPGRTGAYAALPARLGRPSDADTGAAALRADERRVIVGEYRDVIARMNLPDATASRLEDLLADRIEAFLDAQDAAERQGFAEGSAAMQGAVALAIAYDDRAIAQLLGAEANGRLNRLLFQAPPEAAVQPEPAAPATVVTVVVQAPPPPAYPEDAGQPAAQAPFALYAPYWYGAPGFVVVGNWGRPAARGHRVEPAPHRPPLSPRERRS